MTAKQVGLLAACGISLALTAVCGYMDQADGYATFFGFMAVASLFAYMVDD